MLRGMLAAVPCLAVSFISLTEASVSGTAFSVTGVFQPPMFHEDVDERDTAIIKTTKGTKDFMM